MRKISYFAEKKGRYADFSILAEPAGDHSLPIFMADFASNLFW